MSGRIVKLVVVGLLGILPSFLFFGEALAQQRTITVSPGSAAPGETVTLSGSGWPGGARLVVRLSQTSEPTSPSADMGAATVDAGGTFSTQGTVPPTLFGQGSRANLNVVPGTYVITAFTGPGVNATTSFTVGAPKQGGLLWGAVFFDLNNNGMLDATDIRTLADVSIQNVTQAGSGAHAITDNLGHYVISPISPGSYSLRTQSQYQSATWTGTASAGIVDRQATQVEIALHPAPPATAPSPSQLPRTGGDQLPLSLAALMGAGALLTGAILRLRFTWPPHQKVMILYFPVDAVNSFNGVPYVLLDKTKHE